MADYDAYLENKDRKKSLTQTICLVALYVILFLHIYRPLFLSFSQYVILVLFPLSLISITFLFRNKSFIYCLKTKDIFKVSIGFLCLFIYTAIIDYTSLSYIDVSFGLLNSTAVVRTYFDVFLSSIALFLIFKSMGRSAPTELIHAFLWIAFFQFLCTFAMMSSSSFRDFINIGVLLPNKIVDSYHYQYRLFGLSSEQLFTFPLFNGLTLCSALWLAHKRSPFTYLPMVFFSILPIVVNARIGLVGILAFLISFVIVTYRKIIFLRIKYILKTLSLISLIFLSAVVIFHFISDLFSERMVNWIVNGAAQIFGLSFYGIEGDGANTLDHLLKSHFFLPNTVDSLLLGDSRNYDPRTDIGYVKMIFSGGLVYLFSYFGFVSWLFFNAVLRAKDYAVRGILLCGLIMLPIANLKGLIFASNGFLKAMFLLCIFVILDDVFERNEVHRLS